MNNQTDLPDVPPPVESDQERAYNQLSKLARLLKKQEAVEKEISNLRDELRNIL